MWICYFKFERLMYQTPRIALFVRSSVPKKHRIIYTAYIHNRIIDLCNVHHTSVHHTYMIQEASYIHKSWKRCIVSCIIHSGSGTRIIDASYIQARFRIKAQDHLYVHNTHMYQDQWSRNIDICIIHACIRIKIMGKCIINMCIVTISDS